MTALAPAADVARPGARSLWDVAEVCLAAAAFAVLCVLVLRASPYLPEPDDYAYRASIVAMTDGHFFTLSGAQAHALAEQLAPGGPQRLGPGPGGGPIQWVQLPGGGWISEKDPGYPYLAVVFQALGVIRLAPLFYGALACLGLYVGGRRWLGRFGGAAAVGLYCSSGAAILFAWRDYMPTFTEASLIAAGTGALLWAVLAAEASARRRTWVGLAGFVALEAATFSRYTNIVVLGCAVIAVLVAWRLRAARLPGSAVAWWLASVCVFGAGVAIFNTLIYGGPLRSGYRPGEITFSLSAIGPNLRYMPAHLIQAMPMLVLGLAALAGIAVAWLRGRRAGGEQAALARRDLAVAARAGRLLGRCLGLVRHLCVDRGSGPEHAAGGSGSTCRPWARSRCSAPGCWSACRAGCRSSRSLRSRWSRRCSGSVAGPSMTCTSSRSGGSCRGARAGRHGRAQARPRGQGRRPGRTARPPRRTRYQPPIMTARTTWQQNGSCSA